MDASVDQSDGECDFDKSDYDFRFLPRGTKVLLKKDPELWVARNPDRLLGVTHLKLELPDYVYSISNSIGDLLNLENLIIKGGINLSFFPPTLLNLVWLQLENCPNLSQLPSNFSNLVALRFLTIQNCGIKFLPQSLSLIDLARLVIINCVFIQELPASLHVETLRLVGCNVKSFSAKPRYLRTLEINNCLYVNDILTSLNHFDSLHILLITDCDMESLPNSITVIHNLKSLEIKDCINLKRLPQNLSRLAYLNLVNCGLECIPSGLRSLTSLSIENCPMEFHVIKESVSLIYVTIKSCNIKSLDGCITGLTKLKHLCIEDCVALKGLPTDINTLVSLQRLWIEGCTSIKFLPSLPALHNLYSLSLKSCSGLDELPADLDELTKLRILNLTNTNVQSLPSAIAKLSGLKNIQLPGCFRLETLPNDLDLKRIKVYLPRSFRLDTRPAKFSVTKVRSGYRLHKESSLECDVDVDNADDSSGYLQAMVNAPVKTLDSTYQLRSKDQKESSLEIINNKECDVDVDDADKSDWYWQTMVNTPPNLTHLPQPCPGSHDHHVEGRDCDRDLVAGKVVAQLDSNTDARNLVDEQVLAGTPGYLDEGGSSLQSAFLNFDVGRNHMGFAHDGDGPSEYFHECEHVLKSTVEDIQQSFSRNMSLENTASELGGGHGNQLEERDRDRHAAGNFVGETINHAFENEQLGIMTSGCEVGLEPLDVRDVQNVPVKSKRLRAEITLEMIQQCISRNMTLVNAAEYLGVSRSTMKRRLKELKIEWPANRKGIPNHSSKKKIHNINSTFVSDSLERSSVDRSVRLGAHASECSDDANQLMLPDYAEKHWMETPSQMCSVDVGANVIGEPSGSITPHTVEDVHTDALTLVSEGSGHHRSQESEGAPFENHHEASKILSKALIESLMDEGISQEAAAEKLNVSLATLKHYMEHHACGIWPSGSKPSPLESATITGTVYQEHTEHLHSSNILAQRLEPVTVIRVDGDTINANQDQICRDTGGFTETSSSYYSSLKMDESDDQSDAECEFDDSDGDVRCFKSETRVLLLKKEPGSWIAHNPSRRLKVINLKLELPDQVYNISDSIGNLHNLTRLIINRGITLSCLPHSLPTLLHLETLHLENCPNLSELPYNFGNLIALRYFIIRNCGIKSLPHSFSQLKLLDLELNNCVFIQELPPSLDVDVLKLVGCHVKSFSAKPRNLQRLELNNCLYVPDIRTLKIEGCGMKSLPDSITGIHNLENLKIKDCMNLKKLPENLSQLADLNNLTLVNCGIESIPSGLRRLACLKVENCPMEFLVIKEFVSLTYVKIKSCGIKSLDGCITGLTKLEDLTIEDCVALEDLPTDINTLVSLRELRIKGCSNIKFLPNIAALHNLELLSLKGCSSLNNLPLDVDKLTNLNSLYLTDTNVQSLPSTIVNLSTLKDVHLPGCFRLETLPNDFDLKEIDIYLPLSVTLDTVPAKFSVTTLDSAYQLRLKDQKGSSLEIINDKECNVDDDADNSNRYGQTMVNTPPNLTYLPQPRPASLATVKRNREHNACDVGPSRKKKFSAELDSGSKSSLLVSATTAGTVPQEHTEHFYSTNIPAQRFEPVTVVRVDGGTINATQEQTCGDTGGFTEACSVEAQNGRTGIIVVVKAEYKEHLLRFDFLSTSSVAKLKEEVMKRLPLQEDRMMIKYKDEDNDWVLLACADDLRHCLGLSMSSESKTIRLMIVDS